MRVREDYRLVWVGGEPYLLPFGQAAANHQRGVRLNKTGVFLWHALEKGAGKEELLARLVCEYQPTEEEIPVLEGDLALFLGKLLASGILLPGERTAVPWGQDIVRVIAVGGITAAYRGPEELFAPEFAAFCAEGRTAGEDDFRRADLRIRVSREVPGYARPGRVLVRSQELMILETEEEYLCLYGRQCGLTQWYLSKDGSDAVLYCREPVSEETAQEIFHAVRMLYLVPAQRRGMYALHSASVLYRGKAWLFSGHSGAGKSTHAALWREAYGTPLLNGDLNLLELREEEIIVHGMPWCGTSGVSTAQSYPLGGVVFVRQSASDEAVRMDAAQGELAVWQHLISPMWTEEMFRENLAFSHRLAGRIPLFGLRCTKNPSAAAVMKAGIESVIN